MNIFDKMKKQLGSVADRLMVIVNNDNILLRNVEEMYVRCLDKFCFENGLHITYDEGNATIV